jgi:hypothetical protein
LLEDDVGEFRVGTADETRGCGGMVQSKISEDDDDDDDDDDVEVDLEVTGRTGVETRRFEGSMSQDNARDDVAIDECPTEGGGAAIEPEGVELRGPEEERLSEASEGNHSREHKTLCNGERREMNERQEALTQAPLDTAVGRWGRRDYHLHSPKRVNLPRHLGWPTLPGHLGRVEVVVSEGLPPPLAKTSEPSQTSGLANPSRTSRSG